MNDNTMFDHPQISSFLFHPRGEGKSTIAAEGVSDLIIPVEDNISIGGKFYNAGQDGATVLFFHGNGEIAADYDDIAPLFVKSGINFAPVDYRGYGRSGGKPSVSTMMYDCNIIFEYMVDWLRDNGYRGPLVIMGRSLGSASALEIAKKYQGKIAGLIIESGFAFVIPLLDLLGINTESLGITDDKVFCNSDKIMEFLKPTLIIHARNDHIIPYTDGVALFNASVAEKKKLVTIPDANHNTILLYGLEQYMQSINEFIELCKES